MFFRELLESVGLANRQPGEKFKNPAGHVLVFHGISFYPEDGGLYSTPEELDAAVKVTAKQLGIHDTMIKWTNAEPKKGGFGISHFVDPENNHDYYLGRWFNKISHNRQENKFPNNSLPGEYQLELARSKKESLGYKPTQILQAGHFQNQTPESIYRQIESKFGADSDEALATRIFIDSHTFPITIPKGNIAFSAFQDYFCELLQPIALVMNKPIGGNADDAAKKFFGATSNFSKATISFNNSETAGLYDSLLVNYDGKQIKLSSKGKSGATASAVNLTKSLQEIQHSGSKADKQFLKNHQDSIEVLETINSEDAMNGPLTLGVRFAIITDAQKQQILHLKSINKKTNPLDLIDKQLGKIYTDELAKSTNADLVIPLYLMVSAIAKRVSKYVNDKTKFGNAAAEILNQSALVQINSIVSETKDTIIIKGFHSNYPSKEITGVILSAQKTYFNTGNKGKLTFKILKNNEKFKETDDTQHIENQGVARATKNTAKEKTQIRQRK